LITGGSCRARLLISFYNWRLVGVGIAANARYRFGHV
jgi:hypothetical protein